MKIKEGLFNIVFPPRCPVCDEVIHVGKDTCEDCRKKVVCIGEATAAVLGDRRVLLPAEHTAAAIADLIEEDYLEEGKDWKEKEDRDEKISQIEKQ